MVAFTTPDGFVYETTKDQPGTSLRAPDEILAEQVQAKFQTTDATLATIQAELARGWKDIVNGDTIAQGEDVPIASSTYDMIRVTLRGNLTEQGGSGTFVGFVNIRVNNDTTAALHRRQATAFAPAGTVEDSDEGDGTVWHLALWGTSPNNLATALIVNTHESARLSFEGGGIRAANTSSLRSRTISSGDLDSNRLLTSLRFGASTGTQINEARVWIEGHVAA